MSATPANLAVAPHRDYTGAKMGMWLFLFTEVLLFGGLFILYAVYRSEHPEDFHHAAAELDTLVGTINTIILLTSSMTMAVAIACAQKGKRTAAILLTWFTIACGAAFMVNKYFEWTAKFSHGIYPNSEFLLQHHDGEIIFFGLYFTMTGLHGLHVIIGMILLAVAAIKLKNKPNAQPRKEDYSLIENGGLYWHLVDLIWIYLFPLFYLIT